MRNYLYTIPPSILSWGGEFLSPSMDSAVKNAAVSTPKHNWHVQHCAAKSHSKEKQKKFKGMLARCLEFYLF